MEDAAMTISKMSHKARLALYAMVLGIGAQLAPEASIAADTTCINACNIDKQACLRAAKANADLDDVADAIAACYSEWTACLGECNH
jgi:ABC-type protease/lipase transport system fused ATPase/permease subunit